jgi:putative membrane protein
MIYRPTDTWLRILFSWRYSALSRIWLRLTLTTAIAAVVTLIHLYVDPIEHSLSLTPFTLISVALGIFLGFRNNTSYDRFWEGRRLWGSLVNTSRSLTRQCMTLIGPLDPTGDPDLDAQLAAFRHDMVYHVIAYVHGLRLHLRNLNATLTDSLAAFLPASELQKLSTFHNPPIAILFTLSIHLRQAYDRKWIHAYHLPTLEASLTTLTDIQGGCERIKSTPIPFAYTALIHRIVSIYCLALPFGIVSLVGWATPFVVLFVSFAFFGLDAIGDEIEEPFGIDPNDLPLDALSRMIEVNLKQTLGEQDVPPLLKPSPSGVLT